VDRLQAGWEYRHGFRPFVEVARRGSLVIASEVSCQPEVVRAGLPIKAGEVWLTGLNSLVPLDEYYRILGG